MNIKLGIVLILFLFINGNVTAKNIDYSPDLASNEYWNEHRIYVIQIVDISVDGTLTLKLLSDLSGDENQPTTVAKTQLWFGQNSETAPTLHADDILVFYSKKNAPGPIVAVKLLSPPEDSDYFRALKRISVLRKNGLIKKALIEGALDDSDFVSRFSLKVITDKKLEPDDGDRQQLMKVLNRDEANIRSRIMASDLLGKRNNDENTYTWGKEVFVTSKTAKWQELNYLVDRLLTEKGKREELIDCFLSVLLNTKARMDSRISTYRALVQDELFLYKNDNDKFNERIIEGFITCLSDQEQIIKGGSGASLVRISNGYNSIGPAPKITPAKKDRKAKIIAAIENAKAHETDPVTVAMFDNDLKILK